LVAAEAMLPMHLLLDVFVASTANSIKDVD
jgi:hypothetical protein